MAAFLHHFDDPRFFGAVLAMPMDEFRRKVKAADGKMIKARPMVLFFKGGAGSGWFSPSGGGTHVKRMPHRDDEARSIGAGYDAVHSSPHGDMYDLLTLVKPVDMDAVAVSRGGWKGIGDITVRGSGFGYVKFIWRHGEESKKSPEFQVAKEDVMAFAGVLRDYEPSLDARHDSPGREWRVIRNHPMHGDRTIVYADSVKGGGRHLVSVYVQEPDKPGADIPLSKRKTDAGSGSPGKRLEAHTGDTSAGFLHQPGQSASADSTIPNPDDKSTLKAFPLPGDAIEFLSDRQIEAGPLATTVVSVEGGTVNIVVNDEPVWLNWSVG